MTELEYLKEKLADTKAELERAERNASFRNLAELTHGTYDAFVNAGFNEEQAWWFTGTLFQNGLGK